MTCGKKIVKQQEELLKAAQLRSSLDAAGKSIESASKPTTPPPEVKQPVTTSKAPEMLLKFLVFY